MQDIFERRESAARSYCRRFDSVFAKGNGSVITDVNGRNYIDFLAGAGSLNYGHNDPDMASVLIEYIQNGGIAHTLDMFSTAKGKFLEAFERLILQPRNLDYRVQFTGPTGANAVEAAIKLARKVTGRTNVIAFTNGFHGVTLGALATTANDHFRASSSALLGNITRVPYDNYFEYLNSAELLQRLLEDPSSGVDKPAAILLETVQGEGGLNCASHVWLGRVNQLAKEHGALLIVDDIQAGCGRAGNFFSFQEAAIVPDIVTLSKSLSGMGLPLSVVLIKPEIDQWKPAEHNGTFRGNTHAMTTATVALEKFWSDNSFVQRIEHQAEVVFERLSEIAQKIPGARLKGRAMMQGIDVGSTDLAERISRRAFHNGLIVETSGSYDEVIKVFAPLTTPDDVLHSGLDILKLSVEESNPEFI